MAETERIVKVEAALKPLASVLAVQYTPERGCCIVAARDLDAGSIVVEEQGVALCPEADYQKHVCDHCYACPPTVDWLCSDPSMPVECKGCRSVWWCGEACRDGAREEEHTEAECNTYNLIRWCKSAATQKRRRARQLARLMLLRQRAPTQFESALLLCTNRTAWPAAEVETLEDIAALTAENLPEGVVKWPEERELMADLLMAINCNQFAVHNESADAVATGVFVVPGLFNHSCAPSLQFDVSGSTMTLTTTRAVIAGEELCHSYLQTCEPELLEKSSYDRRQKLLKDCYFFQCQCTLCTEQAA